MATTTETTKRRVPTKTQVFRWKFDAAARAKLAWSDGVELVAQQVGVYKPDEVATGARGKTYLALVETARGRRWERRADPSMTILALKGEFGADGHFVVGSTVLFKDLPGKGFEGWCKVKLKLEDSGGGAIALKDAAGSAVEALDVVLPGMDLNDDVWSLELVFAMEAYPERRQDRISLRGELGPLLNDASKWVDRRLDGTKDRYRSWTRNHGRRSYERFFVHCTSAVRSATGATNRPLDRWFEVDGCTEIFDAYGFGAHFLIGRDGKTYHCVRTPLAAQHAPPMNTRSIGVELIGLVDDLSFPIVVSWQVAKLALGPPETSAGSLSEASKRALKRVAKFACTRGSSVRSSKLRLLERMIDAMAPRYRDADFDSLTSIDVPSDRATWDGRIASTIAEFHVFDRALRLMYWRAVAAGVEGDTVELRVELGGRVRLLKGEVECTRKRTGLATSLGVTVASMSKGVKFPGRVEARKTYVQVPKSTVEAYLKDRFTGALELDASGREATGDTVTVKKLLDSYATRAALESALIGYTPEQYAALADLTQALHRLYHFESVWSHHSLSRRRKRDPGSFFDWDAYLGHSYLADMRKIPGYAWDADSDTRRPKAFAERTHSGRWGT